MTERLCCSMRPVRLALALAVVTLAVSAPAAAQSTERPQRSFRGLFGGSPTPDPDRSRQELTLTVNLLGGYDDNLAGAAGSGTPTSESEGGYIGNGDLSVRYYRGRAVRSLTFDGNAYATKYGTTDLGLVKGGTASVSGVTQVRRRDSLSASQYVSYEPLLMLNAFGPLDPIVPPGESPQSETFAGLSERRSINASTNLGYQWAMARRSSIGLDYGFQALHYLDSDTDQGNSTSHRVSSGYSQSLNRSTALRASYGYRYGRFRDSDGIRPLTEHTIEAGPHFDRALSRTRRIQVSLSGGAQYVRTLAGVPLSRTLIDYWTPFASTSAGLELTSSWRVQADYRRGTTVLPEVTTESYVTDAVSVGTSALFGQRLDVDLTVGVATGTSAVATGSEATYRSGTLTSSARWAFSRRFAALFNYYYYDYRFTNTGDLPDGFNPSTTRHSFRVGITMWVPLVGNYIASRSGGSRP
jgi:hypothetical protein